MQFKNRTSKNYQILKEMLSKYRRANLSLGARYFIIFTFLYKYCSDSLKDQFLYDIQGKELTLDEAYDSNQIFEDFKYESFQMFGFFIKRSDAFMDEVINSKFHDEKFLKYFFDAFSENVVFEENSRNNIYFKFIFDTVREEFPFDLYEMNPDNSGDIKDIIYSISKLDVFDPEFLFADVFDAIGYSGILNVNSNPEYIYQILDSVLKAHKNDLNNIYDPFFSNGMSFLSLADFDDLSGINYYGKETDRLTYCYALASLFVNYYDFDRMFVQNDNAFESVSIDGTSFDAVISAVPIVIRNYPTSNKNQHLEIAKRNKRKKLEKILYDDFNMDLTSFSDDIELNSVLEKLVNKMDVADETSSEFGGEYESLNDSEFLFLINLINTLKDDGIMAISISQNFLFKDSLKILRKYLTFEKNYIHAVINIPNEFGRYKHPDVVIVFKKNRSDRDILFIDMSRNFETKKSRSIVPGLFRRNLLLADETVDMMVDVLTDRMSVDKYSNIVSVDDIVQNDFNLSVSKYVDTFEGKFIRLDDLIDEKRKIDDKCERLNQEIEFMMNELNINFEI